MLLGLSLGSAWAQPLNVYFGTGGAGAEGIYQATFHPETGKLSPSTLAARVKGAGFLALHPNGSRLYAVAEAEDGPGAVAYEIGPKGALTPVGGVASGDGGGAHIAVHPSGRFLLTAQYGGGSVALFPLDEAGNLGQPTLSKHSGGSGVVERRQDSPHPHWCGFSPDGRFALVPDLGLDQIVIYKVDLETPAITPHGVGQSVPGGGPRHMRFSPDGAFIYLLNELSLSVTTFSWDAAAGVATPLNTVAALSEEQKAGEAFNSAAEILVHPGGQFVYSSNRGHDTVSVFSAQPATGALELIQIQPVRGAFPRNINLSPDGNWLLAAGADSNTVSVHRLDPATGRLTYQTKGVINVPAPICILFGPQP
jgi:6-phosphogluconolactonase